MVISAVAVFSPTTKTCAPAQTLVKADPTNVSAAIERKDWTRRKAMTGTPCTGILRLLFCFYKMDQNERFIPVITGSDCGAQRGVVSAESEGGRATAPAGVAGRIWTSGGVGGGAASIAVCAAGGGISTSNPAGMIGERV